MTDTQNRQQTQVFRTSSMVEVDQLITQSIELHRNARDSFMMLYNISLRPLLKERSDGFACAFDHLVRMNKTYYRLLETGTMRDEYGMIGEGGSTLLFDWFLRFYDGMLWSVDIESDALKLVHDIGLHKTQLIYGDSVSFLYQAARMGGMQHFDLIYLDSFDGFVDFETFGAPAHQQKELTAMGKLASGTIVMMDDMQVGEGYRARPKGIYSSDYCHAIGWQLLYMGMQSVWMVP